MCTTYQRGLHSQSISSVVPAHRVTCKQSSEAGGAVPSCPLLAAGAQGDLHEQPSPALQHLTQWLAGFGQGAGGAWTALSDGDIEDAAKRVGGTITSAIPGYSKFDEVHHVLGWPLQKQPALRSHQ